MAIVLSFDVEEHNRIEAAAGLACSPQLRACYANRMEVATSWLLDTLARHDAIATFFIVGQIARSHPKLVRDIAAAGHEVASHGWDHARVHRMSPAEFRSDLLKSKHALEQATGTKVVGYRAPTFSVMRETAWAIDALVECGYHYDSSVFPVRHDRYGVPAAPRVPFVARGQRHELLELPPATLRLGGVNLPAAGGGYFRLFPLGLMERAVAQLHQLNAPAVLYFHPWEFDPDQPRLPLGRFSRWRTYVGTQRTRGRLLRLLRLGGFRTARDVAEQALGPAATPPRFALAA